ncbi:NUDIX domain-containing protein [Seinonella peptonophila]|uniref:NUDIX domain-containing protein n=1 Tax=Seinonella peptonophila TaxID=112248 RepID=UPI000933077D|nr:NUDIX domain-containing protein [Seinonella peptonophila]
MCTLSCNGYIPSKRGYVLDNSKSGIIDRYTFQHIEDGYCERYKLIREEEIEVALRRELEEETGILCEDFELKTAWSVMRHDGVQLHILLYKANYNNQAIRLSSEHDGYQWVGLEDEMISTMPSWITKAITKMMK